MTELSATKKKNTAIIEETTIPADDTQAETYTSPTVGHPEKSAADDAQEQQNLRLVSAIQAKATAGQSAEVEETELFEQNRGLVIHAAQKYEKLFNHTLGLDDLVNSGSIGLMTAARSYDPTKGAKFSTYATYWIRDSILKEIYNTGFNIRVSNHQFERIMKVQAIKKRYDLEHLEGDAMIDAIVRDSGFSREEVERCLQLDQEVLRQTSLNTKVGSEDGDATELGDIAVSPDNVEDQVLDEQQIQELYDSLDQLSEEERNTLVLRYGLFNGKRHTLREIAELYHVSPEAIRQREQHAIKTIRNTMNGEQ
ncbi:MAG: sigma-70 family RNA polymerase sigma factor [Lachnospiraceae bacterium]|nr:sigma-70 family RNA polymerase sigma factor [Lachnospiraceae bacterium]